MANPAAPVPYEIVFDPHVVVALVLILVAVAIMVVMITIPIPDKRGDRGKLR
jgi:hypothetical protein